MFTSISRSWLPLNSEIRFHIRKSVSKIICNRQKKTHWARFSIFTRPSLFTQKKLGHFLVSEIKRCVARLVTATATSPRPLFHKYYPTGADQFLNMFVTTQSSYFNWLAYLRHRHKKGRIVEKYFQKRKKKSSLQLPFLVQNKKLNVEFR